MNEIAVTDMKQLRIIQARLKKPSVIISLISQIGGIILLISHNGDINLITKVIIAISSILVTLGIVSNPDSHNAFYGDDICICTECHKPCAHVEVNGTLVCCECGHPCTHIDDME